MNRRILLVDDEPHILMAYEIRLRDRFEICTAPGGSEALAAMEGDRFAVVCSDMRMPGMDGIVLLAEIRRRWPDTVRMMLTGNADLQTAIDAVNQGHILRFLTKPCDHEVLASAFEAGVELFRLVEAERVLLTQTLHGIIRVLTDLLSLVHPIAFGRTCRLRQYIHHAAARMDLEPVWSLELAAMLSQLGCIAVPEDVLERIYASQPLEAEEAAQYGHHAHLAAELIGHIPRFEDVAAVIALQDEADLPDAPSAEVDQQARRLRTLIAFDRQVLLGRTADEAAWAVCKEGDRIDRPLAEVLGELPPVPAGPGERRGRGHELDARMTLAPDGFARNGTLLVTRGVGVTAPLRMHLARWARKVGIDEPVRVAVAAAEPPA